MNTNHAHKINSVGWPFLTKTGGNHCFWTPWQESALLTVAKIPTLCIIDRYSGEPINVNAHFAFLTTMDGGMLLYHPRARLGTNTYPDHCSFPRLAVPLHFSIFKSWLEPNTSNMTVSEFIGLTLIPYCHFAAPPPLSPNTPSHAHTHTLPTHTHCVHLCNIVSPPSYRIFG